MIFEGRNWSAYHPLLRPADDQGHRPSTFAKGEVVGIAGLIFAARLNTGTAKAG